MTLPGTKGRHRIYLMRHGEVSYFDENGKPVNPRTVQLTDRGRQQAREVGKWLKTVPFDRVTCSGLPRTRQTAEEALSGRDLHIAEDPGFEEIHGGRFRDIPKERREAEIVYGLEGADEPGAAFAGGETFVDFRSRVESAFTRLLSQPNWSRLLLVAHDGVNRVLLSWAVQAGLKGLAHFEQDMGCLNIIDIDLADGEVVRSLIKAVNLTPYDPAKLDLNLTSMEQVMVGFVKPSGVS